LLSRLGDDRLGAEIEGSLEAVAALTGRPCRSFAYPNGRAADFDDRATAILAARGVEVAVTTISGANRRGADPLRLRRWGIGPEASPLRFAAAAHGLPLEAAAAALGRG
jgi:peptidoglycan/xylan/chitin deacetylase (PgdA/CDA1 family)